MPSNRPECPRRRGGIVRYKARSLPALAAAVGLLGAGLGVPALWRAAGSHPASTAGRPSAAQDGAAGARPVVPPPGTSRLTSFSLPATELPRGGAAAVAPLHGLLQADMIVVAPSSLPSGTLAAVRRLPGGHRRPVSGGGPNPGERQVHRGPRRGPIHVPRLRGAADGRLGISSGRAWQMARSPSPIPWAGRTGCRSAARSTLPGPSGRTCRSAGSARSASRASTRWSPAPSRGRWACPPPNAIVISAAHANLASLARP